MPKGILNKASLVMAPEAPIDGTMPSVFPEDRSGDFTFTRGSNLAATRVASNGLIEKGRENLLLQSNQFDTTPWNRNLVTATSGQSGYDGNTNAWKIDLTGAAGNLAVGGLSAGNVGTYSVYAKAGTLNWILLGSQTGNIQAYINLLDGSIGTTGALVIEAKTEDVGGGWYRCSMTYSGTATVARVYPAQANGNLTATSGNILVQDSQLEIGLAATSYIESGATTGKAGLLENEPRIDFTGGGCGSLLLEPSRTNLVTNSEYFEDYTKTDSSVMSNGATSPEGLENASKLFDGTGSTQHYIGDVGVGYFTNTDIRNTSLFVKAGTLDYVQLRIENLTGNFSYYYVNVNLNDGSVASIASGGTTNLYNSVKEYGNGWYRITIACSFTNSNVTASRTKIYTAKNNNHTYTGTGTDYILIYGAQAEAGSYPTSYIPTYGSSATRSDDDMYTTNVSNLLSISEGTLYTECDIDASVNTEIYLMRFEGTDFNNTVYLYRKSSGGVQAVYRILGTTYAAETSYAVSGNFKIAASYSLADGISLFLNGVKVGNIAIPEPVYTFVRLRIGGFNATLAKQSGHTKEIMVFPTALTDEECSALTQP